MPVEVREYGAVEPQPTGPGRGRLFAAIALVLAVVVAVVVALTATGDDGGDPEKAPSDGQSTNTPPPPGGLEVGDARADLGHAQGERLGLPTGLPRTVAGATEWLVAYLEFWRFGGADLPLEEAQELWSATGDFDDVTPDLLELRSKVQAKYGLSDRGDVTSGGPGDRFYNECLPEFGMYRGGVTGGTESEPTEVMVMLWMPCVEGVGSPNNIGKLRIDWLQEGALLHWKEGRWVVDPDTHLPEQPEALPRDLLRPNVSAQERSELFPLPAGEPMDTWWQFFDGWSVKWPTELLGEEPK